MIGHISESWAQGGVDDLGNPNGRRAPSCPQRMERERENEASCKPKTPHFVLLKRMCLFVLSKNCLFSLFWGEPCL